MKVALCTISSRAGCAMETINSLLRQTIPCEIHVFVSHDPFLLDKGFPDKSLWPDIEALPIRIHWVPNWASYRKTLSFMKMFPEDIFLAVDDDEYFHPTFLQTILDNYKGGVLAFRATRRSDIPYNQWEEVVEPETSVYLWHKGNGGVVYDSRLFQKDYFFDDKTFLDLAPTSDDVWINLFRMYNKIPVQVLPMHHRPMPQPERLWFYNATKNDEMIEKVSGYMNQMTKQQN